MSAICRGCGRSVDGCLGIADACRYRIVLAAAHKLLVVGSDPALTNRQRQRHRNVARARLRSVLDATTGRAAAGWPTWARKVDAEAEGRGA